MSCQDKCNWSDNTNQRGNVGGAGTGGCVTSIVRRILDAQRRVTEDGATQCVTSCEQSIEDLLSPSHSSRPTRYTTIPFMLQCKGTCKTFVASGFTSRNSRGGRNQHFHCLLSPVYAQEPRGEDA